ncbi:hypothetical protein [Microvirga sp. G4-2]|uniref:hypothetical protein n=1 Tax=Microvirga sp. G4-2 TaxID=3434467 RepID=UPI004043BE73
MARKPQDTTRDDVNEGDVRASVADDPTPRPSNPQTYDGGDVLPADAGISGNSTVDNTAKGAPEPAPIFAPAPPAMVKVEPAKHEQLKGAKIRLTEKAYIGDVLYDAGAVIEDYSGPKGPHMEVLK